MLSVIGKFQLRMLWLPGILTKLSFGGKYIARFLAAGNGLDAGFTAHPSGVEAAEWQGVASPLSIAFGGELSFMMHWNYTDIRP